ncbi:MAG TPA: DUF4395 family protein [Gaiellaceae bacterium]|nr:DUF4395 family protein [Gaiellaceae bacterium]
MRSSSRVGSRLGSISYTATRRGRRSASRRRSGPGFTVPASLLWYAAGLHIEALALVGVIAVFATLESAFGVCVGCKAFYLGMRVGLVPPHVCEDCAPFLPA